MRVNPYLMPDLLAALAETQQQQDTATLQIASGSKINKPSDDPAGSALLTQIHDRSSQADSFLRSIGNIRGQLQTADSTLSSVVTALQRAIGLGVQGGTGTLSDENRAAVAQEVSGLRDELISLANLSYQGRFVFAGTSRTLPFVSDATVPSGVRYDGNAGVNTVAIGDSYQLQVNQPGSQIFANAGADVFQAVTDLLTALQTNTGIDTAVAAVRKAFDYVTTQRVFYGNALNQIDSQQSYLNTEKLQLSDQENTVDGVDMAAAASQLVNAEGARNATLAAVGKVSQLSLFDYLK
ncbi:MAG: flagellar hook-associated protein FlgL [Acidobacteriia bacterium]|nr:flagellar hook-associated protein FlgL [Terriglobia bacterium]